MQFSTYLVNILLRTKFSIRKIHQFCSYRAKCLGIHFIINAIDINIFDEATKENTE